MMVTRFPARMFALSLMVLGVGGVYAQPASISSGQGYPYKSIRILTSGTGGDDDFLTRIVAQGISGPLGQPLIVDNRPTGVIPSQIVASAPADGYTLLSVSGSLWTMQFLTKALPFDAVKDFAPISLVAITPNVLVVNASLPVNSAKEFVAYARANSGKLAFGSGSNGSAGHLAGELFKVDTGTDIVHVPYKGGAPATQALLAGDTQFMFDNLANAMPQVKAGKLKALAVTTAERSKLAPELPTMAEAGLAGFDISTWFGLLAPAGTPKDVIAKWNAEVTKILNAPDMRERLTAQGAEPAPTTPEQFAAFIQSEIPKYARIVKISGAKVD